MTPEQYLAVARQCGATVYTNRHYPLQPAVSFGHAAWLKFCEKLDKPAPNTLSVVTEDPCPGCRPGVVCRTPSCGRLSKINLAKASEIGHTVDQALKAWGKNDAVTFKPDEHESLTFHPLEHNGGKTGWPPGLLQDDSRKLSKWFASRPDALYVLRKSLK